jgi:hypothetical protein
VPASPADPSASADASDDDASDDGGSGVAVGLGTAGLVLGAAGLGAGVVALRRTRRAAA